MKNNPIKKITIGSRGSDLALWQANFVKEELQKLGATVRIKILKTKGDKIQDLSFDKLEGKGFFTKELEDALLNNEIDLAVHSHKDLPTTSPKGLVIAAVSDREDPSELLLIHPSAVDETQLLSIKKNAVIGTSSARRKSQLLGFRPDVQLTDIRGNVPTRIQKLRDKKYDGIMLAKAGIMRLNLDLSDFLTKDLKPNYFIPAPAQGVLALQIRETDSDLFEFLQPMNNQYVQETIAVERKVLNLLDGGCQLPLGAYCIKENNVFKVWAARADSWNSFPKRIYRESKTTEGLAHELVSSLKAITNKSVFISRDLSETDFIYRALSAHQFSVSAKSLIQISKVRFSSVPQTDWIFFSSRNSVRFFFEQEPIIQPNTKFAVIGKGTESVLREFGKIPHFVGHHVDTLQTAKEFRTILGDESVLFPGAKDSLRSIQKELAFTNHIHEVSVYRTDFNPSQVAAADIYIFTSPSNVESFFTENTLAPDAKVLGMGLSTSRALESHGVKNCIIPVSPDEVGLTEAVFSLPI